MLEIIIINYNSTTCLLKCLATIENHIKTGVLKIVVIDNNSEDGNVDALAAYPLVELIVLQKNIGYAAAVNLGLKKTAAPFVMLLNPDTYLKADIASPILEYMEKHPSIGILGPKVLNDDGCPQGSARSFPTFLTGAFGRSSLLSRLFPNNRVTRGNLLDQGLNGDESIAVDWVSGACMVVRREAVDDVGGMDERFFMYWEDADWCRRMREKGWEVIYSPSASVYHSVARSSKSRPIRSLLEFHKSAYRLYAKYATRDHLILKAVVFSALAIRFYLLSAKLVAQKYLISKKA